MGRKIEALLITFLLGTFSLLFGEIFWPPSATLTPTIEQVMYFLPLYAVEAALFGAGVAFAFMAFPLIKKTPGHLRSHLWYVYISMVWLLVSWWPHERLHLFVGTDVQKTLYVDYGFHLTTVIASLTLAISFAKILLELQEKA